MKKVLQYTNTIEDFIVKSVKDTGTGHPGLKIIMPVFHKEIDGNTVVLLITSEDKIKAIRDAINYALGD